jgi:subtilisin
VSKRGRDLGIAVNHEYTNVVQGFSATLTPEQVRELRQDDSVLLVEPNVVVQAHDRLPTGVNRIGADSGRNGGRPPAGGEAVAVFDTGVANHPDLNVVGGTNCTGSGGSSYLDRNGHGTHVAGTIGAKGSVPGVAPNTPIYAVKVLGDNGQGTIDSVICGLDWVARSPRLGIVAINMSLGASCEGAEDCGSDNPGTCRSSLHRAICNITASGIDVVVSAGNDGKDARTSIPARYDEVITVGAFTDTDGCLGGRGRASLSGYGDDRKWRWSNFGPAVDVIAPGDDILSTVPGGYGVLSGTSMAAPHVTGAIARGWNPDGGPRAASVPGFYPSQGVVILSGNIGCPPKPKVKVSRKQVTAGTRITVRLRNFAPGERVRLRLGGRSLGTVVVNSKGAANKTVKVPAGSKRGRVPIRATGANGNSAKVKVSIVGR